MLPGLPNIPPQNGSDRKVSDRIGATDVQSLGKPLATNERGLILPSSIEIVESSDIYGTVYHQTSMSMRPDALDLRQAVLFWDAIHLPEEALPIYQDDNDIKVLESIGLVRRYSGPTQAELASIFGGDEAYVTTHGTKPIYEGLRLKLFTALERSEPGQWAMGRGIQSPEISGSERVPGRGILVKLTNMLPIPDGSVNFHDVIAFREKRIDELIALRSYMTELFAKVACGDVDEMVKANAMLQFERSIKAYQEVLNESKLKAVMSNLASGLNIAGPVAAGLTGLLDPTGIIPISLLAIGGAVTIAPFSGLARRKTNEAFEYIGQYHREITWHKP